ncbi:hypothetical protein RhiirA1_237663 [Rhizophagus irregularis]|uniref:Uncharacterized protein n=1 Tax=Rhizophagus irregularis TaxID=588596 RepID=A0A2N0RJS7_9GLOM|nr:hypothetical protein RhiirA1_237663 [Rhizophagus irregularis]
MLFAIINPIMVSIHIAGSQFFLLSNFFFIIYSRSKQVIISSMKRSYSVDQPISPFSVSCSIFLVPNVKEDLYSAEFLSLRSFLHFFQ